MTVKQNILSNLPYLLFLWVFEKLAESYRTALGVDVGAKILAALDALTL